MWFDLAGGPITDVTQAETWQVLVHGACPLLLPLGNLQPLPGEWAWASVPHNERKGPSYPHHPNWQPINSQLIANTWGSPAKTNRRTAYLSPAQIADSYSRHEKLVHSLNVHFSSRKTWLFLLVWMFSPKTLTPSNLRYLSVSTFFDRPLSKLFIPRFYGGIRGWVKSLEDDDAWRYPSAPGSGPSSIYGSTDNLWKRLLLQHPLGLSRTVWRELGPFLRVPFLWYPFNSWHFQTSPMCARK